MHIERLSDAHSVENFDCGEKSLNDWLKNHGVANQARNLSRTFVLVDDTQAVIGYFSLVMGGVAVDQLPRALARGLPRVDIGAVLLARLAIRSDVQDHGLGRDLMVAAIERAVDAGTQAAARFIMVDPLNESARAFYERFGFRPVAGDAVGRMYVRMDEAADAVL